jgi:hypothetical protein
MEISNPIQNIKSYNLDDIIIDYGQLFINFLGKHSSNINPNGLMCSNKIKELWLESMSAPFPKVSINKLIKALAVAEYCIIKPKYIKGEKTKLFNVKLQQKDVEYFSIHRLIYIDKFNKEYCDFLNKPKHKIKDITTYNKMKEIYVLKKHNMDYIKLIDLSYFKF